VPPRIGFWAKWLDSVAPRTIVLIAGVPLLQLGFILSYMAGALVAAGGAHLCRLRARVAISQN
jgi:hypothetical protein